MATRAAGGTFATSLFTWERGLFTLVGEWTGGEGQGAVRLLVTIDGQRRRIQADGGRVAEDGPRWGARFHGGAPDPGTDVAIELAGREYRLPAPELSDEPAGRFTRPPAPAPPPASITTATAPADQQEEEIEMPADVSELKDLLTELRQERQAVEAAIQRLHKERTAAEQVSMNLPKRQPLKPLPKKKTDEAREDVDYTPAYWVGAFALFLFFLVLIWVF